VKVGEALGEDTDHGLGDLARVEEAVHHAVGGQAAHVDGVVDDGAFAIDGDDAVALSYRGDAEVGVGAEAGVEDDLAAAVVSSLRESREVQEAEVHGLFDLVDMVAGEEDVGDMGLEEVDAVYGMGIGGG
jgi:hypothetical protein